MKTLDANPSTTLAPTLPAARGTYVPQLILFFLCLYLFSASGHIESFDGGVMFGVTADIVRFGNLHPHSPYGLTLSLVAIPFYVVGQVVTHVLHFSSDFPTRAVVSLTNAPITALTCGLIASIAQHLEVPRRSAIVLALIYGTCTLAWPYAKTFFSEPLTGLLLLAAFWALLHVLPERPSAYASLWIGVAMVALGLAVLARETTVIVLPVFAAYLVARVRARVDRLRLILVAGATLALCLLGVGLWNIARFGSPLATGYSGHLWTASFLPGLYGLLLSPYKGLILYVPLVIAACAAWPRFYRRWPREALLCGGVFLIYLAVHSAYLDWPGGGNWGPRFLVPALPFLLFALPFLWTGSLRWRVATAVLCVASLLVQLPAVYVSYARYYPLVGTRNDSALIRLCNEHPLLSPIIEQWRSVPIVTANLRHGLPAVQTALNQKLSGQPSAILPLNQVLRRSITVNVPDFWFVYLGLSKHLSRLIQLVVALLALAVVASGIVLIRMLYRAPRAQPVRR